MGKEIAVVEVIAGFRYVNDYDEERNGQIVKIVERATVHELLFEDAGPCFVVEFPDGERQIAMSVELNPWFEQ